MAQQPTSDLLQQIAQAVYRRVEELEALFDVLPVGLAVAEDPQCRHIRVNRAYARMLAIPQNSNASMSAPDAERPPLRMLRNGRDIDPRELPMQRAAREAVAVRHAEIDVVRADGSRVALYIDAMPLFNTDGSVRGVVSTAVEISDRLRVEREQRFLAEAGRVLAASLEYEATLQGLASLVVQVLGDYCFIDVLREDGFVTRVAVADADADKQALARELQAFPPSMTIESDATRVIRSGEPFVCRDVSDEAIARAAQSDAHETLLRNFNSQGYLMLPLRTRGRTLGLLTVGTHHAHHGLDTGDLHLAQEVASRAALALDNALLYRHAQDANRLKDEFLATLSHELRTPLNALIGWAQILRSQTGADAPTARAVESIERNAQAQLVLINDLLDVSRVISGKLRLEMKPVDIASVVAAAVDAVRPAARARDIDLGVSVRPLRLQVTGDADRLQQVTWNLLSNAVKFTPRGGRVDVDVEESGGAIQIFVRDTGMGIDPAFLPFVFDRFRQGDSSTTRSHGGLGLGLAIVRHLVDLHGGSVTVESEGRDQGARFIVTLPGSPQQTATSSAAGRVPPTYEGALHGVRVMAVDDDPDARALALLVLEAAGADVVAVAGVDDALKALDRVKPDVIIADIAMPERDGYDLLREIRRRHAPGDQPPVIALTAYVSDEDAHKTAEAGFVRHLGKPVDHQTLVSVVASCVSR